MTSESSVNLCSDLFIFRPYFFKRHKPQGSGLKPKPRSGHRVACDENNLYSYGGFNPDISTHDAEMRYSETWAESKPLFKELWKFNFTTQRWKLFSNQKSLPDELASNALVLKGEALVVHGGTGVPFGENCNNKVYICNVRDGLMMKLPDSGNRPDPQYGQSVICIGDFLYTVGGTTGYEYTCDVHRFNLRTLSWEQVYICSGKDLCEPKGRYRHELAFDGRNIFVLGGGTASDAYGFEDIPVFDTVQIRWLLLRSRGDPITGQIPAARRCHGLVYFDDENSNSTIAVMSGGYNGTEVFNDVWRLDLKTMLWSCLKISFLPEPVYFHSTALTPAGQMYTFGGIVKSNTGPTRTDAIHSIWLKIPKLSEICWEAVNHYFPNLKYKPQNYLLNIGIPLRFVRRIEND